MATQLKNVKFGQAVLCSISTTDLNSFDLTNTVLSGGTICGGSVTTDSLSFATSGGMLCGKGGTISDARICGGSITTDSFAFASCGGRFYGNGGTIDLGSGYLENATIGSTCTISGTNMYSPTICGGSLTDVSIGGSSTHIYDANISGANLYNMINNYGTICSGSIADVILSGSISNYGTINGGAVSNFTLCGLIANDGTISGGVISGSSLSGVSFSCGDTVVGNYATITAISLSGATFNDGSITGIVNVCGNGQLHLYGNNCIDFTSGGWMQMNGIRYMPQLSGNQLVFLQA